jgi:hypothetical protein
MKATLFVALLLVAAAAASPETQVDADFDDDAEFLSDIDGEGFDPDVAGPEDVTDLEQTWSPNCVNIDPEKAGTPITPYGSSIGTYKNIDCKKDGGQYSYTVTQTNSRTIPGNFNSPSQFPCCHTCSGGCDNSVCRCKAFGGSSGGSSAPPSGGSSAPTSGGSSAPTSGGSSAPNCVVDSSKDKVSKKCETKTSNKVKDIYCIVTTTNNCGGIVSATKLACTDLKDQNSSSSPAYNSCSYDSSKQTVSNCKKTKCSNKMECKMMNPTSTEADVNCYKK